jgi:hypothetical protein
MNIGAKYWTYYKNNATGYIQVLEATNNDDMVDAERENEGRVFTTQGLADKAAKGARG